MATINELSAQGYVERAPDAADARRNVITITAAGRRQLRKLDRLVAGVQDQLLEPPSPKDRDRLISLLTRLVDHHANP